VATLAFKWGVVPERHVLAETLMKLCEHLVETQLVSCRFAQAWDFSQIREICMHPELKLIAAVQIYIEHGTVVTQEYLKVGLQSRVRLRHACDQGKVTLYPLAELDLIGCVLNEAVDAPLK
tara:strand:- start:365 stop:727 length:363 start_codon:yes stop_codon:yes gene_type:complete